tara:strand:- start:9613 stop:10974 length:1362 start_codon:yes stop_codon:yes gene_type:complete
MNNFSLFYDKILNFGTEEAIVDNGKVYTYEDIHNKVLFYDNFIKEKKVKKNEVVSIYSKMSFDSICLFLSLSKNGQIIVPISEISKNKKEEFQNISFSDYEIKIKNQEIDFKNLDSKKDKHDHYNTIFSRNSSGLVVFSSGSTGKNKAAVHDLNFIFEKFKKDRHKKRIISFLLFDHLGGINTFLYALSNGGCLIIPEDRTPESVFKNIQNFKAELLPTSPSFINLLLLSNKQKNYDLSSLKMVSYGTEIMHEHTLLQFRRFFPKVKLLQTYGLTEIGVLRSKSLSSDSLWVKLGGEEFQTRVVDNKLQIKGNSTMLGYLNHKNPFTEDGWLITNDNVEVNGDYYKILGRDSDIINIGGQKVYPTEVEEILLSIDNIIDASVYGEKNMILGEIVCANVVLKEDKKPSEIKKDIRSACLQKIEKYKIPVKIKIVEKIQNSRFKRTRREIDEKTN